MIDYSHFEQARGLNWYEVDPNLQFLMDRLLDPQDRAWSEEHLRRVGALCGGPIAERAEIVDKHPPRLEKYDRWGEEVNEIIHHPAALANKKDLWEGGVSGSRLYEEAHRRDRPFPPALGTALSYLLSQADTGMLCAVGMTAGVASLVERLAAEEVKGRVLTRLTAGDFADSWDGAMFMTEREGGSDVGAITTTARKVGNGWVVSGRKWFCSNVDAAAIATLARPEGAPPGIKGVALFLVPKWRADGSRNLVRIRRIKDKLGTRSVPTAEVDFLDAEAYLLAGKGSATDGQGINRMMEMVNPSRLGVATMGLGIMRRCFLESAIFAARRQAFGRLIQDFPMVRETLVEMIVELEAAAALVFAAAGTGDGKALQRILIPLTKFRAARRGIEVASAAVEIHGGNGYIEDWPVARQLRDAQCHTIWEGTENIICLDVLRALRQEGVLTALVQRIEQSVEASRFGLLKPTANATGTAFEEIREVFAFLARAERDLVQLHARRVTGYLADVAQAALLLEEAQWELEHRGSARKAVIAHLFTDAHLRPHPLLGITSGDRTVLDLFDPVTRYGDISPAVAERYLHSVS